MIIELAESILAHELLRPICKNLKKDRVIKRIVTDSKEVTSDSVFIGIKGANDDGNKYSRDARLSGGLVISNDLDYADVYAKDGIEAIKKIASNYKEKILNLRHTIAITGSVGKTTTKNILKEMLGKTNKVHATNKNFNNLLGVSITILTAPIETEILVAEAGMNHKGELLEISDLLKPDIAIITNIGTAHIGNLGNREAIASAKLEIVNEASTRVCIVPYGEPLLSHIENKLTFSPRNSDADCFLAPRQINMNGSVYDLAYKDIRVCGAKTNLVGEHILELVSAAACSLLYLGYDQKELEAALQKIDLAETRAKLFNIGRISIYDDSYNASFESILASFSAVRLYGDNVGCVIGDVLELGEMSESIHKEIGNEIARRKLGKLYTFGKYARFTALAAINAGMHSENVFINDELSKPEITAKQISNSYSDEIILVKASRATGAERIFKELALIEERRK